MTKEANEHAAPSHRTRLRRYNWLAKYDLATVHAILGAGLVCQVGYVIDGEPYVTPTNYWRIDDHVYWHGSSASRMLKAQARGIPVCFTVTHLDGIVFARASFNHNVNFRSVMLFGDAEVVEEDLKRSALERFTDDLAPGLWDHARTPTEQEWKATKIIRLKIREASAKVRTGPPIDDDDDYKLDAWAGVVPIKLVQQAVEPDPKLRSGIPMPRHIRDFRIK